MNLSNKRINAVAKYFEEELKDELVPIRPDYIKYVITHKMEESETIGGEIYIPEFDDYIVITKDGYNIAEGVKVIKVSSFKELLDARNSLNKPIIFSKINNVKAEFIVEDESTVYRYVMKEADL